LTLKMNREADPTRTKTLRNAFVADMNKRFLHLRGLVRKALDERDVFALKVNEQLPARHAFDFPRSKRKVEEFMAWLDTMVDRGIFDLPQGMPRTSVSEVEWANTYIDTAYKQGLRRGNSELRKAGYPVLEMTDEMIQYAFNQPIHADRVGLIYTRVYSNLKGITAEMDTQISRILAEGLASGENPRKMADTITKQIYGIQKKRARTLAQTEVIRAHHHATMGLYEEAEVEGVALMAEWSTAGDDRVCALCDSLSMAGPYTLEEAWGMVPAHPLCRCCVLPLTLGDVELALESVGE
jgi:SPP1 gp7 family putative phage head morphogenesis protein